MKIKRFEQINEEAGIRDMMTPKSAEDIEYIKYLKKDTVENFDQACQNYLQDQDNLSDLSDIEKRYLLSEEAEEDFETIKYWNDILTNLKEFINTLTETLQDFELSVMGKDCYNLSFYVKPVDQIIELINKLKKELEDISSEFEYDSDTLISQVGYIVDVYPGFCKQHKNNNNENED